MKKLFLALVTCHLSLVTAFTGIQTSSKANVTGASSATDGHLAVFDGTTGKLIKDGGAVPGGGGNVSIIDLGVISAADVYAAGYIELLPAQVGRVITGIRFVPDNFNNADGLSQITFVSGNDVSGGLGFAQFGATVQDTIKVGAGSNSGMVAGDNGPLGVISSQIGNRRFLTWTANTKYAANDFVIGNGHAQTLSENGGGTSGSGEPAWDTSGGTTSDGTCTWRDTGDTRSPNLRTWEPLTEYFANDLVIGSRNYQIIDTPGISGATEPSWDTNGGTTNDGSVIWSNTFGTTAPPWLATVHAFAEVVTIPELDIPRPTTVEFLQQPTNVVAGEDFDPPISVRVLDQNGNPYIDQIVQLDLLVLGEGTFTQGFGIQMQTFLTSGIATAGNNGDQSCSMDAATPAGTYRLIIMIDDVYRSTNYRLASATFTVTEP